MLWSFVYLVVRNLFALVWLLERPRRSKELEMLVLREGARNSIRPWSGCDLVLVNEPAEHVLAPKVVERDVGL